MKPEIEDPIRLVSSSDDPLLREALRAASDELATSEQLAAVAAKLGPILGGGGDIGGGNSGGGAGASASLLSGASAKVAIVIGAGALVSIGLLATRSDETVPRPTVTRAPSATTASAAPAPPPTLTASTESASHDTPSVPSVASSSPPLAIQPLERTRRTRPSEETPAVVAAPAESEVKTLGRAQDALRTDPGLALSICDDHAKRFPNGLLPQEREVIAIDALTRLGKMDAARARARLFRAAHPSSSHLGRVEVLVGTGL